MPSFGTLKISYLIFSPVLNTFLLCEDTSEKKENHNVLLIEVPSHLSNVRSTSHLCNVLCFLIDFVINITQSTMLTSFG